MKFLDLFAGIGGFRMGLEQAGHECVGWVEWDKFARKSYQAIHDTEGEYEGHDIKSITGSELPAADIWAFGSPCTNISIAGNGAGLSGEQSSMFFEVMRLLREIDEKEKPKYLFMENVKNLLSSNRGWDFARVIFEMDKVGYDVEWDVLDSAEVVPQHRKRIFIIGHFRGRRTREVFPIRREDGETNGSNEIKVIGNTSNTGYGSNDVLDPSGISTTLMSRDYKGPKQIAVRQVGNISGGKSFGGNPQTGRVYDPDGISPTLSTMQGGGREPKIAIREATKKGFDEAHKGDSANLSVPNSKTRKGRVGKQLANTLETSLNQGVVIPTLMPDRINKRQNGRRFKEDGDPEFTLTAQDRHGIYDGLRIRKLTPRETWRLQGFPDWAFDRAEKVNSNSQLYKQAGNSVTVPVIYKISKRMN